VRAYSESNSNVAEPSILTSSVKVRLLAGAMLSIDVQIHREVLHGARDVSAARYTGTYRCVLTFAHKVRGSRMDRARRYQLSVWALWLSRLPWRL
jgi:hypothetical protein